MEVLEIMAGEEEKVKPEEIKEDLGLVKRLYKKYKVILVAIFVGAGSAGGTMLGLWKGTTEPAMQRMIDSSIVANNKVQDSILHAQSGSFRSSIAEEKGIKKDEVVDWLVAELDSAQNFQDEAQKFKPFLERELSMVRIGYYIELETGEQGWYGPDLQGHRLVWEGGKCWTIYHGHRKDLKGW